MPLRNTTWKNVLIWFLHAGQICAIVFKKKKKENKVESASGLNSICSHPVLQKGSVLARLWSALWYRGKGEIMWNKCAADFLSSLQIFRTSLSEIHMESDSTAN